MKYIAAIVVVACMVGVGAYLYSPKAIEYVSPSIVEKEVVKEVPTLEMRIVEAQNASSSAIETEARKAYETRKEELLTEIELRITREYKKEIEAREVQLEKEVGEY
jgi:hypothetical protein